MTDRYGQQLHATALLVQRFIDEAGKALGHIREELTHIDNYPTQTIGASAPTSEPRTQNRGPCPITACPWSHHDVTSPCPNHAGATLTPTERAAHERLRLRADAEQIVDDMRAITQITHSGLKVTERIQRQRIPTTLYHQRCTGTMDPTCQDEASEHHTADGTTIHGLCDKCWFLACPRCYKRPAETRRRGLCEACRRHELRYPDVTMSPTG